MICRRYFPGFIEVGDEEHVEHRIDRPEQALEIDWIKQKIAGGYNIQIEDWAVMSIYPDAKYVIALLLTDDGKEYIK